MAYADAEARKIILAAGRRLLETGLIARTWGNISARVSDTKFIITPSGLAYETLLPEQLVTVNLSDCSYDGAIKPSSETGIHADAYRLRPQVQFVIHTHQEAASIWGVTGSAMELPEGGILGRRVPCARYGLSSTKKLRRAVAAAAAAHPDSPAVLMRHHGALCMGTDMEHAFAIADALETACAARIAPPAAAAASAACGNSVRNGNRFALTLGGITVPYDLNAPLSGAAALHGAIYRCTDARWILHETDPGVVEISTRGATVKPMLDDLAQIAGISIRCVSPAPEAVVRGLRGRAAVLLQGAGGLCTGVSQGDAEAVSMLLRKDCAAQRFALEHGNCRPVGFLDALLERTVYVQKYAARKNNGGTPCKKS